jgi:penicillin-binding protein 2
VEHGNAGAQAAAPVARDIKVDVLTRDPGRQEPPANRVADKGRV